MRRILPVLMMVLILFGCAPREYETVRDVIPAGDPADAPFEIRVEVPAEAAIVSSTVDERVYEARNGDYTVTVRTIVTDGLDAAVYALTGSAQRRAGSRSFAAAYAGWTAIFAIASACVCGRASAHGTTSRSTRCFPLLLWFLNESQVFPQHIAEDTAIARHIPAVIAVQYFHRRPAGDG